MHAEQQKQSMLQGIIEFIESYLQHCAIHGLCYLIKKELVLLEKCLWLILFVVSLFFCMTISLQSVDKYFTKSTVVGLERDYYYWNTTLPSVTICPLQRLNITYFEKYCRDHGIVNNTKTEFYHFLESLANATFVNLKSIPYYDSIDTTLHQLNVKPANYMELISNLTYDNTFNSADQLELIAQKIRCTSEGGVIYVRQVLTEFGLCYTANSFLHSKYSASYFIYGTYPETHFENFPIITVQHRNYFDFDMEYNCVGFKNVSIDYFIHGPFETIQIDHNYGFTMEAQRHEIDIMEIMTTEDFQQHASISQRNCRFQHETNLTHFPVYTKNLCLAECRLNLIYETCKCIPHFYPNRVETPKRVCSYKELRDCVAPHKTSFIKLLRYNQAKTEYERVSCYCLQNCKDTVISERTIEDMHYSHELMGGSGVILAIKIAPKSRLKRQIIFSFTDLLVSIGGTAGLFLGFSVLGAVEFVYYFTLRLLCFLCGLYRNHY